MVAEMDASIRGLGVEPAHYDGPGYLTTADLERSALSWRTAGPETAGGVLRKLKRRLASRHAGRELASMPLLVADVGAPAKMETP